jgi:CRP/FNR family cyclic AMP-dependent transcriptional regulator
MTPSPFLALAARGWLAAESPAFRDRLLGLGRMTRLGRGRALFATGDVPDAMFGIAGGHADISLPVSDEGEVLIHRAGPGFWIGDSALLARAERTLSVTAATDCDIFRLPGPALRAHLSACPEDWPAFFRLNHANATMAVSVLAEMLSLPPRARFARTLLRLMEPDGTVPATQEDLARLTGMSRASFRRAMADVIASGVVQTGYGTLRIHDRALLTALAAGTDPAAAEGGAPRRAVRRP